MFSPSLCASKFLNKNSYGLEITPTFGSLMEVGGAYPQPVTGPWQRGRKDKVEI